jgi:hypothetical protein
MKSRFALILAAACIVGSTPGFARGGVVHGLGRGGFAHNPTTLLGASPPSMPTFESRIPAPLPAPTQPPAINGPSARSPYGGVM